MAFEAHFMHIPKHVHSEVKFPISSRGFIIQLREFRTVILSVEGGGVQIWSLVLSYVAVYRSRTQTGILAYCCQTLYSLFKSNNSFIVWEFIGCIAHPAP